MSRNQKPGETPDHSGRYREVGPRGGDIPNGRIIHVHLNDHHLPPTQQPDRRWKPDGGKK